MGFFYLYYALGLPAFLSIVIALYLLFTGANSSLVFLRGADLYFVCAGSGEAFNVGQFLEETSPYLWASTGIGLCIGFSVLGAGWCVHHTQTTAAAQGAT
jgi:V-type H+-transporting ATPase proteolipid subunit